MALIICLCTASCSDRPNLPLLGDDAVIVAFGDSITFGTGAGPEESYPAVLEDLHIVTCIFTLFVIES